MSELIYDCFLFFNELDLLEIRLNILSEVADKFVLVEANKTFTNIEKPFYFGKNSDKYETFMDKIIHIKITEYPETHDSWEMERYQRNQITRGLTHCSPDDIILISDLDEIPNPDAILKYKKTGNGICRLKQLHFDYYLNYQRCGENKYWYPAKIARYNDMISNNLTPQMVRSEKNAKVIKNGGWHFSFLGGIENIKYKIQSFSHKEWNSEKYINDQMEYKIRMGLDLFDRKDRRLIPVKMSRKLHPQYILDNKEKYSHLIYPDINYFVSISNMLYCFPFKILKIVKLILKKILPKSFLLILRIKLRKQNT